MDSYKLIELNVCWGLGDLCLGTHDNIPAAWITSLTNLGRPSLIEVFDRVEALSVFFFKVSK